MTDSPSNTDRLDSWKAIARYLGRDVATVRRWEASLGLPVRRVAGSGRSVFAYKSEIDAWLKTDPAIVPVDQPVPPVARRPARWRWAAIGIVTLLAAATAIVLATRYRGAHEVETLQLEVSTAGIVARTVSGDERWRHTFPADRQTAIQAFGRNWLAVGGRRPAAYAITTYSYRRPAQQAENGELFEFSLDGALRRTFAFDDEFSFGGKPYGPPWAVTALAVSDATGRRRIAVAGHHFTWHPSAVTILDENWRRIGTFAHAGWLEAVEWVSPDRLLIGGYSEAHSGGMVALLDPDRLSGQGPEEPETPYYCDDCPAGKPLRVIVMPRTEVNLASGWRFNRAFVELPGDRILARTIELEMDAGHADVVYEFSSSLKLLSARFSDRYWDAHRRLETEGKLDHARVRCPDRNGPRTYLAWTPAAGWQSMSVR